MKELSRVLSLFVVGLCAACASGGGTPESGKSTRSPSHDYKEQPRGGDGEVLGADKQAPGDWLAVGVTNEHAAHQPQAHHDKPAHQTADAGAVPQKATH